MRQVKGLALAALLGWLALAPRAAVADVIRKWQSGDWMAGAYANDETKTFAQCRASRPLDARDTLIVIYTRSGAWGVTLASSDPFRSAIGAQQGLTLQFDTGGKWTLPARTTSVNLLEATVTSLPDLVDALKRGRQLTIGTADGHHGSVALDGTDRVMGELIQCVQGQLAVEKGEQAAPTTLGGPVQAAPPSPQATQTQALVAGAQLELVATRIASNLLLQAQLPNAHLLSPADTPNALKGMGAAWTSEAGFGSVAVLPPTAGHDSYDVALQMIIGGAKGCKGEFAAGRSTTLVDDALITKAFTACNDSVGTRTVRFFVLHREGSWYIVHAMVPAGKNAEATADSPLRDATFQAAVVKAALYQ
jgi:hypothetical protein